MGMPLSCNSSRRSASKIIQRLLNKIPDLGVGVEWRFIAFTAAGSVIAIRVALSIIKQCLHAPRNEHDELVKWANGYIEKIDELANQWEHAHGSIHQL
jgi:hypothetical protein